MVKITRYQNDTRAMEGILTLGGVAEDITGYTVSIHIGNTASPTLVATIVDGPSGAVSFDMTGVGVADEAGEFCYQIYATDVGGLRSTYDASDILFIEVCT